MRLLPAIRHNGQLFIGDQRDNHDAIKEKHGLPVDLPANTYGFSPGGDTFLSRRMALSWLSRYEPDVYKKVIKVVPEDGLHSQDYATAKGIKQRELDKVIDLSNKKALVFGRAGLYAFLAQKLGEKFGKVWYYHSEAEPYPESVHKNIGKGLDEIQRVDEFWPYLDKADGVFFFDCYDGELQHWLRSKGYRVFGSGKSERIELDKDYFLETLAGVGLPVPKTYRAVGLDETMEYLKNKGPKWLKTPHYRGDFETHRYPGDMAEFEPWIDDLRNRLGVEASKNIEILIQNTLKKKAEAGYDGFCINGEFTKNCIIGYEIKDKGLIAKVFDEPPESVKIVNDKMSPIYKKLGYQGHYSTEIIFDENGKGYFLDATCRAPSPPSELMCELYENYAEACWLISGGIVPTLKPKNRFGAEIILTSPWHEKHELTVKFPTEYAANIKLKNHCKRGGEYHCIPAGNGAFFGAAVAYADTWQEARDKVLGIAKEVKAEEMDYDAQLFDAAEEQIKAGEEYGIPFD